MLLRLVVSFQHSSVVVAVVYGYLSHLSMLFFVAISSLEFWHSRVSVA